MPVLQRYTIASGDISERFIFHANPPMYSAETIDRIKKGEIRIVALSGEYSYADMFGFVYTQCFRYSRALPLFGTHNSQPAIPPRFFTSGYECQGGGTRQRAQDFKSKTKFGLVSAPKE
jgi:hypothetical protein